MGSKGAFVDLGGPATLAWSAVRGAIADPREVSREVLGQDRETAAPVASFLSASAQQLGVS